MGDEYEGLHPEFAYERVVRFNHDQEDLATLVQVSVKYVGMLNM